MKLYFKFFLMNLKSQMQYKASFFLSALGQFIVSFTTLVGILFMFQRFHQVDNFSLTEVLLCYSIVLFAFSLAECFAAGFNVFPKMIQDGRFDRILVRPRHEVFQVIRSEMNLSCIGRLIQAIVVFIYAIINVEIHWSMDKIVTVFLMIVCGGAIFSGIYILCAACSFFTIEGLEFINVLIYGGRDFGKYPFSIYGKPVLLFLTFVVPLALFQYYPLLYLIGHSSNRLYMLFPIIGLLFLMPCYMFWRYGIKKYRSTGS